eukprot:26316_1
MVTILLLYFVTFSSSQTYPAQSDGDFILVEQVSLTFDQANDYCLSTYGTTLVSIHNDAENSVVANLVSDSPECGNAHTGMLAKSGLHWTDNTAYDYQPGGSTQHMITNGCGSKYQCGHVGASGSWWCGDCAKSWTDVCLVCNGPNYPTTPDPTIAPSNMPSLSPTTTDPTIAPSNMPSLSPTTTDPTIAPSNMPSLSPTTTEAQSELYYIHGKLCNNLDQHLELIYDVTLVECVKRCKYAVGDNCLLINYFNYFKNNNDSRCYVFAKLCDIKVDSNNNNRSIIVYKTYNEKCIDYPSNWKDNIGDSCTYYLSSNWCNNETILQNQNEFILLSDYTYGLSAISTCCECGGGIYEMDDVGFSIDNNWTYHEDILCKWNNSALTSHLFSNNNNTTLRSWDNIILYNLCSNLFDEINCNFLLDMKFQSLNEIYSLYWCTDSTSTDNTNSFHFILDIITNDTNYNIYVNSLWFNLDLSYYSSNVNIIPLNYSDCVDRMFSINRNNTTKHGTHPCYVMDTIHPTILPTNVPTKYPTKNPTENPTKNPTKNPTNYPTNYPTKQPTKNRTQRPTYDPTDDPTANPSLQPSFNPTVYPSRTPSKYPFGTPTFIPTDIPIATKYPTVQPILNPTVMTTDTNTDYNNEFESGEISMNSKTCNTNSTLTVIMAIIIGICMIGVVVLILIIIVITKSKKNNPVHLQMSVQPEYTKKQDKEGIYTGISCGEIKKRQKDSTYRSACNEINTSDNNLPVFTD